MGTKRKGVYVIDRFLSKIKVNKETGCWEWTAGKDKDGYSKFSIKRKDILGHRFSYMTYIGDIGDNLFICHKCDNPPCVNPLHFFLGTNSDNMQDAMRKKRRPFRKHGTQLYYESGCRCDECLSFRNKKQQKKRDRLNNNPEIRRLYLLKVKEYNIKSKLNKTR